MPSRMPRASERGPVQMDHNSFSRLKTGNDNGDTRNRNTQPPPRLALWTPSHPPRSKPTDEFPPLPKYKPSSAEGIQSFEMNGNDNNGAEVIQVPKPVILPFSRSQQQPIGGGRSNYTEVFSLQHNTPALEKIPFSMTNWYSQQLDEEPVTSRFVCQSLGLAVENIQTRKEKLEDDVGKIMLKLGDFP